MLQKEVREHKATAYCKYCSGVSFTETPFVVITPRATRVELPFYYCPNCGRKLEAE
jgi:Zn finger protein HypA/HybF involved in hydrogenase expression